MGYAKACSELDRLDLAEVGQPITRDASGEAHVVFDPRGGAGLSTHRRVFNHHCSEAFGGGINRRRQATRTGPDNREIHWIRDTDVEIDAERLRHLQVCRILQYGCSAYHDTHGIDPQAVSFDEGQTVRAVGRHESIRKTTADGKLSNPLNLSGTLGSDDDEGA